ncbi:MAG: hypothetical protein KDK25_01680 [Leptospiraceae bacterium]|nr:hypothetical protein [Leptospiraceae bacterium]
MTGETANRQERRKDLIVLIVLALLILAVAGYGRPSLSYTWDPQNKLVQAWSLWEAGYSSDELFYYLKDQDPGYRFFPHGSNAFGKIDGRFVSAFPVALAALFAPVLALLGPAGVVYVSAFLLLFCCLALYRLWNFRGLWLFSPLIFTFLFSFTLEYGEHLLLALLTFVGLSLLARSEDNGRKAALGGLICGAGVFLRHETLPLLLSVGLAYLAVFAFQNLLSRLRPLFLFTLGASTGVLAFFLLNLILYGHPLGPRFLINASGLEVSWALRAQWALDLLFWHGVKPGLFGYMPALLLVYGLALYFARHLSSGARLMLLTALIYIPLVLLIVPNNGIMDWGPRYFGPILLPSLAVTHELWQRKELQSRRWIRGMILLLALVTPALNYTGLKFLRNARKVTGQVTEALQQRDAAIWVFAGIDSFYYTGTEYLKRPIVSLNDHKDLSKLMTILQSEYPGSKALFLYMPPPSGAVDNPEVLQMQMRNSFDAKELAQIQDSLKGEQTGQIIPGLLFLEGTVGESQN